MSGIGGTPPGAALDQFLRDSYEVVQAVHRDLPSIRAVASHLTPVEDLVEFQNEVTALHAKLGVLVYASELLAAATDPGIDLLTAADAPAQRALLSLQSAALRDEAFFATAASFDALAIQVGTLSDSLDAALLVLATKVSQAELDAALAPILARLGSVESGLVTEVGQANDRITLLISQLQDGSFGSATATALDALTTRVAQTETGLVAESQRTTALEASVVDLENGVAGQALAVQQLTARVETSEAGVDSLASNVVALTTQVANLETGQTADASAIQTLQSRTTTNENTISAHTLALTQLDASITDAANQAALNTSAINGLETRMESSEAGQLALASDYSQLAARVTDTETGLVGQANATSALTTRVEANELGLTVSSEERTALRASLTSTGNYLPNSSFAVNLRGWSLFSRGDGWLDAQLARNVAPTAPGALPEGMFALSLTQDEVPSGNAGIRCANVPVEDLASYILSGYLAAENCTIRLEWRLLNGAGAEIGFGLVGQVTDTAPSARLSDWTRVHGTIPVAADGAQLQIQVWITDCHTGFPKAWLLRPQLEPKVGEQVNPSPWMDGVAGIEEVFSTAVQTLETRVTQTEGELDTLAQAMTDLDSQIGSVVEWRITQHSGSAAFDTVGSPLAPGLRKANSETPVHTFQRGLTLLRFAMTGELASATRFDTFSSVTERNNLRDALLALTADDAFILVSQDAHGIKQVDLTAALEGCGALNFANVVSSKPYVLIGRGLAGKGGGVEYAPAGNVPWQDTYITVVNDTPKGLNQALGEVMAGQASALQSLTTRVTSTETGLTALASDVTALEARVDTTESNISAQGTALSDLTVRVTATEDSVVSLASDVVALETDLDSAELGIQANAVAVASLTSRVEATEVGLVSVTNDITALDNRVDVAETNMTVQAGALETLETRVTTTENSLTSQASSLTQLNASLAAIGGDNMLPNSSFEEAHPTDPARGRHWTKSQSAGVTVTTSLVPVAFPHSRQAMRAEAAAVGQNGYIEILATNGDGLIYPSVAAEKPHIWSALVRGTAGAEFRSYLQWMDSNNTILATTTMPGGTVATGGWQRITLAGTPPAGADRVRVRGARLVNLGATTIPLFLEVDNVQLQEGTTATAYSPSTLYGDQVNASAIQSLDVRVQDVEGEVTTIASAQTALTARMGEVEGALVNEIITSANKDAAHTASINTLSARMTDAEGDISATAGAVSALDTRVGTVEGTVTSQSSAITSLQAQVNAIDADTGGAGAAISALDTRVTEAEGDIDSLSSAVTSLQSSVTNANRVFVQDDPPATAGRTNGDIWIDTNDGNKVYTFNAATTSWVLRQDANKNRVYVQTTAPSGANVNDLWFDSDDNFRMYRWTGSAWQEVTDPRTAANASAITSLTTRVTNVEGVNTSQANAITALESTVNSPTNGVAATSTALSQLTTRVSDAETDLSANAAAITSLNATVAGKASASAVQALEVSVGGSGNLLSNTAFATDLSGWGVIWDQAATGAAVTRNLAGDDWRPTGVNTIGVNVGGSPAANNHYMIGTALIPVEGGKRYGLSAYLASHRCVAGVYLEFFDQPATTNLGSTSSISIGSTNGGRALKDWDRRVCYAVAPANARWARAIVLAKFTGEANPYMWACRPMLEEVPTTQTIPSPWSAGGAESYSQWSVTLDVNGYVSGVSSVNNGSKADFTILADNFYVIAPGVAKKRLLSIDGTGLKLANDLYIGPGRIVVDTGSYMKVMGTGFGTANQFIEWYGPKMALNLCSETNAITYIKTNGDAYFGGTLSAGILRNSVRTTTTQMLGAEIINGPFGTNGKVKNVIVSFSRITTSIRQEMGSTGYVAGSGSNTVTIQIYRKIGSAAEELWYTLVGGGELNIINEFDGPDYCRAIWGGTVTLSDADPSVADRTYRAVVTAWTSQGFTHSSGGGSNSVTTTQSLMITSTEEP